MSDSIKAPQAAAETPKGDMTPAELAAELGMTPKAIRSIMRSLTSDRAGRGGAWALDQAAADAIRKRRPNGARAVTRFTPKA